MKKIIIIILYSIVPFVCGAQDINIVRDLMSKGRYEEALTIIEGLNVVQNDRYSEDLARIERIKNLYNNALSYYKKDYYSRAITNYEEIIKIYSSMSFYVDQSFINGKISICKRARAEYLQKQQEKLLAEQEQKRREELERQTQIEENLWNEAIKYNLKTGYINYLNKYPSGKYRGMAKMKLQALYLEDAQRNYSSGNYREAISNFDIASRYLPLSSASKYTYQLASEKLAQQRENSRYEELMKSAYPSAVLLESFLRDFPQNPKCPLIRGKLLNRYCINGKFDLARQLVVDNPDGIALTENFTPDVKWFMKYIKQRERNFNKNAKKRVNVPKRHDKTSFTVFDGVGIMFGVGGSLSYMHAGTEIVTIESQGATWEEENVIQGGFLGPQIAFSLGDFYNRFNLELGFQYAYSGDFGSHIPLSIAPRWNIIADDFHLFVQPEVAYDFGSGGFSYGGRFGFGWYGAFSIGASYNSGFGHMIWQMSYVYYWSW